MKTAIKLVLIYLACQILAMVVAIIPTIAYYMIKYGSTEGSEKGALAPTMILGFVFMTIYLWKKGYISKEKETWSPVSGVFLLMSVLICFATIIIIEQVQALMPWLPNLMENTFDILQSGWGGILAIAILGPILEELLFRGAITRVLLKKYNPTKAIILSALVFGIFHINPVQIVTATLMGLLLGWIYYKTASLIPCILIHIVNNSLSVYMGLKYPDVDYSWELFTGTGYIELIVAIAIFAGAFFVMSKTTIAYPWKESEEEQIEA